DTISGQDGNDQIYGGRSADDPADGPDTIYADVGNDNVWAGGGVGDRCDGGGGNDRYQYESVSDSAPGATNRDVILAFANVGATAGDQIDLATIDANTGVGGNQAFVFKGTAAISGAGQVNVVASGGDTLIRANTGGTLAPELEIVVQDGTATPGQWVAGDFIL
ncbi:MAG: hypothetical protein U0S49_06950, partial [Rhodospirillales bacterium]|nr:hypothetical protein [Rhodospirillales bacterium]